MKPLEELLGFTGLLLVQGKLRQSTITEVETVRL